MFQRGQEIRTQAPFLFADRFQIATFQQQCKKTLSEILRFFGLDTLSPYEAINWSPVCAAKLFECLLRCGRWPLRREHNAPVSCCNRRPAFVAWAGPIPVG